MEGLGIIYNFVLLLCTLNLCLWFYIFLHTSYFSPSPFQIFLLVLCNKFFGLPLWLSWWRIRLQWGKPGLDPWVGESPWRKERLPTTVFWLVEFHGPYSPCGCKESDTTEWLSPRQQRKPKSNFMTQERLSGKDEDWFMRKGKNRLLTEETTQSKSWNMKPSVKYKVK